MFWEFSYPVLTKQTRQKKIMDLNSEKKKRKEKKERKKRLWEITALLDSWTGASFFRSFGCTFTSCGCCNTLPSTRWFLKIEIYSPTVLEATSLKARCQEGHTLSGFLG
jgi:chromatin segregation and condensation protein Rec8/ScpA/Scc1 (kleisin family)